jgi:hypothetical protein
MSQVTLNVSSIRVDTTNNQVFIICPSSKYNEKGAFKMSMQQAQNIAAQAGLMNIQQLIRNCKGAKLSFDAEFVKEGQPWINTKTGESGQYTKDHWKINNYAIELSQAAQFVLEAAASSAEMFSSVFANIATSDRIQKEEEIQIAEATMEQAVFEESVMN